MLRTGTAGAIPVPDRETLSGLEAALVTNTRLADLLPTVVGVKTTFSEQEAAAADLRHQVLPFVENSAALAPLRLILAIVSVAVPVFVNVTAWLPLGTLVVWLANAILSGDREANGAIPVPVSELLPFTVPEIFNVPARAPVADGVNVRSTVHDELTAIVPPFTHVPPLRAKSAAFVPVMVKKGVESVCVAVPVFETVTVKGELVELTFWFPKAAGEGANPITGSVPMPVRLSEAFTVP